MENKESQEGNEVEVDKAKTQEVKENKFLKFLKKRKEFIAPVILLVVLLITILYYNIKVSTLESNFQEEKQEYQEKFTEQMEGLKLDHAYDVSWIFSWSVRSELLRDNKEQVSMLLNQFVKTSIVSTVSMINSEGVIELSTDKNLEGNDYEDQTRLIDPAKTVENNLLIIPLTGINETIGYLEVRFENMEVSI